MSVLRYYNFLSVSVGGRSRHHVMRFVFSCVCHCDHWKTAAEIIMVSAAIHCDCTGVLRKKRKRNIERIWIHDSIGNDEARVGSAMYNHLVFRFSV